MHKIPVTAHHNYTITATPRILIRGKHIRADSEEKKRIWDIVGVSHLHEPVTEFSRDFLTPGTPQHRRLLAATTKKERQRLSAIVLLQRAYLSELPAAKDMADAAALMFDWRPPEWAISPRNRQKGASFWYRSLLNEGMNRARLVMARAKGGFAPAVLCPDIPTAAFVFSAFRGARVCASCRQLFAPDPERDEKYCSKSCGQNFRQKAYRSRVRKPSKRKGKRE